MSRPAAPPASNATVRSPSASSRAPGPRGRPTPSGPGRATRPGPAPGRTEDPAPFRRWLTGRAGGPLPGLACAALATGAAWGVHRALPVVAVPTAAVALGVLAGSTRVLPAAAGPGLEVAGRRLMRAAVVLLGLKLAFGDIAALGWRTPLMVLGVVAVTFAGTWWLGRKVGLPGDQPLLIATGFSICGASAVAAMRGVTGSDEDDAGTAVALVTLCGSLAIAVLPALRHPLGLTPVEFGRWAGAGVHDVGQVIAVAQTAGPVALSQAVVVKLMRVALLGPLVAGVAVARRRAAAGERPDGTLPAPVPLFVALFLLAATLRSLGLVPPGVASGAARVRDVLTAAALFGLGSAVDVRRLARTGVRAVGVGFASWALIAGVAWAGVCLTA